MASVPVPVRIGTWFEGAHAVKRVALQASVMALFIISMVCGYLVFCCDIKVSHVEELVC